MTNKSDDLMFNSFVIKVADNGKGMDPERVKEFLKEEGLARCSRMVAKMGGKISVRSKPGEGTVFRIEMTSLCQVP
jgi:signal transduction histidine kinase